MRDYRCLALVLGALVHLNVSASGCNSYPEGMAFMGYEGDRWKLYVAESQGEFDAKEIPVEPRSFTYHSDNAALLYIGIDDGIYLSRGGRHHRLSKPEGNSSYTQPAFSPDGVTVYLVEMKDGNSQNTDIVQLDINSETFSPVSTQRSAQFEPFASQSRLLFSHVTCVESCGRIIQEVWSRDLASGTSEQVTLLNNISKQAVYLEADNRIYFSSNSDGNYAIWTHDLSQRETIRLTNGPGIDLYPAVSGDGQVFFIRREAGQSRLMCKNSAEGAIEMPIPVTITDIRELKVSQW
ncbi:TolB family protein [Marinobacter sp.]|uniref:TolB family protein n=1 Tax=Marinobacter sp. TaxID=50741 RepID=UPI0034A1708A